MTLSADPRVPVNNCLVYVSPDEPAFVRRAARDLADYLARITGRRREIRTTWRSPRERSTVVVIGSAMAEAARRALPEPVDLAGLGEQGFVLRTLGGAARSYVAAAGERPRGTAYAVIELIKALRFDRKEVHLPAPVDRREAPRWRKRGMYVHQHWAYDYPYAARSWALDDWKAYIDLLAYLRVNLLQIWSMAAICPVPLSAGDREYLQRYVEVIRYAREERGMEVWIGECANNMSESDRGQPIARREYFDVEVLKDPSDPAQFEALVNHRRAFYEICNDADGYWVLDSDPGGCEGSTAADFGRILAANQKLIDETHRRPGEARLNYWIWDGWGPKRTRSENWRNWRPAIEAMRDGLHAPWGLLPCKDRHLELVAEMGLLDRCVFFPYNTVEAEPTPPFTRVKRDEIDDRLALASQYPQLQGIMGNAQSALIQLPNICYLAERAWGDARFEGLGEGEILARLARQFVPERAARLARMWHLLGLPGAETALAESQHLQAIAERDALGPPGALGQWVFPDLKQTALDLALMLRIHGWAEAVRESASAARQPADLRRSLLAYYDNTLAWRERNGYHNRVHFSRDMETVAAAWQAYASARGAADAAEAVAGLREELLAAGYAGEFVDEYMRPTTPA